MDYGFKVVLWGLGINGRNLIDMFDKDNVAAIIETDRMKQDLMEYQGIPIISLDIYREKYSDYCIVVTPMNYDTIEKSLNEVNIKNYWIQNKCCVSIAIFLLFNDKSFIEKMNLKKSVRYFLTEINLFTLSLYKVMEQFGFDVSFYINDSDTLLKKFISDGVISSCEAPKKDFANTCFFQTENTDLKSLEIFSDIDVIPYKEINDLIFKKWKKDLEKYKNIHQNKRVFIVATGPSLLPKDLDKLFDNHEVTISMNRIYFSFQYTKWRPNYYLISDGNMMRDYENSKEIQESLRGTEKFFSDNYLNFYKNNKDDSCHFFHQIQNAKNIGFSKDFSDSVYSGKSVVYACIQLAVYMGFKEIYLIGCDNSFSKNFDSVNDHFYGKVTELTEKVYSFDFDTVSRAYSKAKEFADTNNIKIYNATRGGKLEVFERVCFDTLFDEM